MRPTRRSGNASPETPKGDHGGTMPAIDRGLDSLSFLPDAVRDAMRRRLRELGGLALIALSILLALALATWSVQDPSLSHATTTPVRNVLGHVRRHRRRPVDAAVRRGRARAHPAGRHLGLAARHPPAAPARAHPPRILDLWPYCWPRLCRLPAAQRGLAAAGRTRRRDRRLDAAAAGLPCRRNARGIGAACGRRHHRGRGTGLLCDRRRFRLARRSR